MVSGKKEYKRQIIMLDIKMSLPASRIVFNRCATWKLVMPVSRMMDLKLARSDCSVCVSNADVASSRKSILGFLRMVRARATRCFSPPIAHNGSDHHVTIIHHPIFYLPESIKPRSPTFVSYLSGRLIMTSWTWARLAASYTSC